jgi:hypothetical protein
VEQRPRRRTGQLVGDPAVPQHARELVVRRPRTQPEGPRRRDDLGTVGPGQAGVAQRVAGGAGPVGPGGVGKRPRAPVEDLVGDRGQQHLLAREVVVDRARPDVQLGAEPAHRQVGQAVVVEHAEGLGDDVLAAVAHVILPSSGPR